MTFITDFADQAVVLPVVVAIGIGLLLQGWRRGAAAWAAAIVATFGTMLVLKVMFLACSADLGIAGLRTPSGHTAASAVVAGGLAALLLRRRRAALGLAVVVALTIGVTRLALDVHSLVEVVVGACVGLAGAWLLMLLAGPPPPRLKVWRIAAVAAGVAVVFHGVHLPAEAHIRSTAARLAESLGVCQSVEVRL